YAVVLKTSRKIKTMEAKVDKEVSTGDVLFTLDEGDSSELREAKKALRDAEANYEISLLTSNITVEQRKQIESGKLGSLSDKQNKLSELKTNSENANNYLDQVTLWSNQIAAEATSNEDTIKDKQAAKALEEYSINKTKTENAMKAALAELNEAKQPITDAEAAVETAKADRRQAILDGNATLISEADANLSAKQAELARVQSDATITDKIAAKQDLYDKAKQANSDAIAAYDSASYSNKITEYNHAIEKLEASDADAQRKADVTQALNLAKLNADNAKEALDNEVELMKNQLTYATAYENIVELRKDVADLEEEVIEPEFKSPINGTVTEILYTAGQTPAKDET
ncbi:MAG: hypothetical protein HUJ98_15350, partial [Bacteroidaceae bacterium]|nr:hypothetical protein [Bacteroidaceae bacterium]